MIKKIERIEILSSIFSVRVSQKTPHGMNRVKVKVDLLTCLKFYYLYQDVMFLEHELL